MIINKKNKIIGGIIILLVIVGGVYLLEINRPAPGAVVLEEFSQREHEVAVASDKAVLLYFYANWCASCDAEMVKLKRALEEFGSAEVVAFKVNFNDGQTTDHERAAAALYGVVVENTKVVLRGGEVKASSADEWDFSRYVIELERAVEGE